MSIEESIYSMQLHDELFIHEGIYATRVPGGWIYRNEMADSGGGWSATNVFVPFDNEFNNNG